MFHLSLTIPQRLNLSNRNCKITLLSAGYSYYQIKADSLRILRLAFRLRADTLPRISRLSSDFYESPLVATRQLQLFFEHDAPPRPSWGSSPITVAGVCPRFNAARHGAFFFSEGADIFAILDFFHGLKIADNSPLSNAFTTLLLPPNPPLGTENEFPPRLPQPSALASDSSASFLRSRDGKTRRTAA